MGKKKFYIDKHVLIPQHLKLSEKDKNDLLERYKISTKEIPKISKSDPAIRSLDVKSGDVIKIVRISPTAGETLYYRVVISAQK